MLALTNKVGCCGCQACANACPQKCISMQTDEEGFLYPQVDDTSCVNCGLCQTVCPTIHKPKAFPILETYAAKHTNKETQLKSSSGGMFSALAEFVLQQGGVVFGASFDKEWNVGHAYAENIEELDKLRRSKYVQSNIGKTYQQAKTFLDKGRFVLFTGTPCQIAGLRNYLGKEYEKLLTAELFCHGVPSPAVWQKFLAENTQKEKIGAIDFRHKRFGWDVSFLQISYTNGTSIPQASKLLLPLLNAKKGRLFRRLCHLPFEVSNFHLYERPSCHRCRFKGLDKMADFTMGDLWGVKKTYPSLYDDKGISVLLVNTPKARNLLSKLSLSLYPIDVEKAAKYNPYLITSVKSHPKRAEFFARYKTENFNKLLRELENKKPVWKTIALKLFKKIGYKLKR